MWCSFRNVGARALYQELRRYLGEVFRKLALQKESKVEEGHLMPDHVHMLLSIPPKYAVSQVVGFIKGKSAIHLARVYGERKRNFVGQHFWARGFFVNTVGRDEEAIRAYIRNQEDQRLEQMNLWRRRLQAAPSSRAASATRLTALSGSHPKAPGFAGGYLHQWRQGGPMILSKAHPPKRDMRSCGSVEGGGDGDRPHSRSFQRHARPLQCSQAPSGCSASTAASI